MENIKTKLSLVGMCKIILNKNFEFVRYLRMRIWFQIHKDYIFGLGIFLGNTDLEFVSFLSDENPVP